LRVVYLPIHWMSELGRPITSTMISKVTRIRMSQTMNIYPCKFWKNSSVIFVSYPCNWLKYFVHPIRCRIYLALFVTCSNVGSLRTLRPPIFLWENENDYHSWLQTC
jgi:hypothetical protein